MESNTMLTWFTKNAFLLPAFLLVSVAIELVVNQEGMIVNEEPTAFSIYQVALIVAFALIFVILWLLIKDKVVNVKLGGQNITLYEAGETRTVNWLDVQRLNQIIFVRPPMYKLRIKGEEGYYLFVSSGFSISFGIGTIDLSEMGSFIKKKKKSLGI